MTWLIYSITINILILYIKQFLFKKVGLLPICENHYFIVSVQDKCKTYNRKCIIVLSNILAAFKGMHVSPAKHGALCVTSKKVRLRDRHTHRRTNGQTETGQSDPYVLLCFAGDKKM